MSIKDYWQKIKGQFLVREGAIFLTTIIVLTASLGFGLGRLSRIEEQKPPVRIEYDATSQVATQINISQGGRREVSKPEANLGESEAGGGEVVASKSGKTYYLPWCSGVRRIKPANRVSFASPAAAAAAGLSPAKNCPGL